MLVSYLILFLGTVSYSHCSSRVLELNDEFPVVRKGGGYWLVNFYAPWCGHCKRLEPIWANVVQTLSKTDIKVGRIDCSRFPSVGSEFGVRGFPTIKFFTADTDFTFNGDRNKEDILNFAVRLAGPPVQPISTAESLERFMNYNKLFFIYIGRQEGQLWQTFYDIATKMQPHSFFYSVEEEVAKEYLETSRVPTVLVHKENETFSFPPYDRMNNKKSNLTSALMKWINEERFGTFLKVTRGNMNELTQTNKYLVLAIVEEDKLQQISETMLSFRDMVENVVRNNRAKYHKYFQFGWIGSPDLANSIAMQVLPLPYLIVLNSTNYQHHIPERVMTSKDIEDFLQRILDQSVPVYGGNDLFIRFYRAYFDASTAVAEMWHGNPILTALLFGLPFSFLSFILYSVCCADISEVEEEEDDEEEDEEEDIHAKRD